jgi:ubiquinone/menaquinone biosynthesis C-methylase UbiE
MNADRIAASYRWIEYAAFGRALELARFDFLPQASQARSVLILGEGDGRFLAKLLELNRHARVEVVESSGQMIELARSRVPAAGRGRVEFRQMDALAHRLPAGPFDLAVSHFFLDVLTPLEAESVVGRVDALLCPGAAWLVSEFQEPRSGFRKLHARMWLAAMYKFFAISAGLRVSSLPPYRDLLQSRGFAETAHRERRWGLIRSQVWRKPAS